MPIQSSDQTLIRSGKHMFRPYWNIWPEQVVATATINEDSAVRYPTPRLKVTSTSGWSDIRVGMRFVITNGDDATVTTGVVRVAGEPAHLSIDAKSSGDTGWAEFRAFNIEAGQTITVYNDYPLWTVFSRIKNGVYYKQWNLAYTDQGNSPDPVCNMGSWQQHLVDEDADLALVTLSASASFAWGEKTITGYDWDLPAGASVITGSITAASLTATFPVGFHLVYCEVEDSDGKTASGIRPIWVNTRTGANAPKSKQVRWRPGNETANVKGGTKSVTLVSQADLADTYYRGMPFIFTEEAFYNGSQITAANVLQNKFVGFNTSETRVGSPNKTELTLEFQSPYNVFALLPQVSQVILERATPNSWIKVARGLADPNFIFWYVVYYHAPNALKLFDFIKLPEATPPRKRRYGLAGTTIQQQTDEAASYIGGNIGSSADGTYYFMRTPTIENTAFRDAMDERITITGSDIVGDISFTQTARNKTGQVIAYGFVLNTTTNKMTAIGSLAPGKQQPQASGRTQAESILVTSQDDLNERTGHMLAKENDPTGEFTVIFDRNFDIFDPARHYNSWYTFDIPEQLDPRGNPITFRALCTGVTKTYRAVGPAGSNFYLKDISATFVRETFGMPGDTFDLKTGAGQDGNSLIDPEIVIDNRLYPAPSFAWNETALGRTYNFLDTDPAWYDISGDISGKIASFALATYSTYFTSGYTEGTLEGYVLATDAGEISIWHCADLFEPSPDWAVVASYTANDATPETSPHIVCSRDVAGLLAASWRDQLGTYVVWSSDFGATWTAVPVQVGDRTAGMEDDDFDDFPYAFALDGTTTLTTDKLDGELNYKLFYASSIGGSFVEADNTQEAGAPIHSIKPFEADEKLLVSMNNPVVITAEVSGWSHVYNFTGSTCGFSISGLGEYVGGQGFRTTLGLTGGVSYHNSLNLTKTWSSGVLADCEGVAFVYSYTHGPNSNVSFIHTSAGEDETAGVNFLIKYDYEVTEGFPAKVTYNETNQPLYGGFRLSFTAGEHQALSPIDPEGELTLHKMYIWGDGTDPDPLWDDSDEDGIGVPWWDGQIFRVDDYKDVGALWTGITPSLFEEAPSYPDRVAVDLLDPLHWLGVFGNDPLNSTVFEGFNVADSAEWLEIGEFNKKIIGVKMLGSYVIVWGGDLIKFSEYGTTGPYVDKDGSWATTIGAIGSILGVAAII